MPNSLFISYRRSDSQHASIALAEALKWAFADGEVFFDRTSIEGADKWPQSIREAVSGARMVLAVIGSGWLKAWDDFGRRRIDHPKDWVRQELLTAITQGIDILPVILDDAAMPDVAAFDDDLAPLVTNQEMWVRAKSWEADLDALVKRIVAKSRIRQRKRQKGEQLNPNGTPIPRPDRKRRDEKVLPHRNIREALEELPMWRQESNYHPWAIGGQADEISRVYEFRSFANATRFMAKASAEIDQWRPPHHPRWENQWRVVKVWFSTWDVGCRVTNLDLESARQMEQLYLQRTAKCM